MDNSSPTEKKSNKAKIIWFILIVLALIASNTTWGLLYFNQRTALNEKISKLTVEKQLLNEELADSKKAAAANAEDSDVQWREIPELGVKYKLDSDTEDLTYSYQGAKDSEGVNWSTIKLSNKSTDTNGCNSYDGTVVSWSRQASELSDGGTKTVGGKKLYRIIPDGGDSLRPANCQDKTLLEEARAADKKAFDSLEAID
ncbi:hypothetical protein A3F64_02700 [Candidatus Saccharibacteria bacterium RIFCSPHIGHO2_12_FULL_42_8]|nr:MAG: hypothetical protein A3F64_02700 [Candidatus Saccharibacteria bacterium RIFCSPHIGHO2_12_FULL_42_8]